MSLTQLSAFLLDDDDLDSDDNRQQKPVVDPVVQFSSPYGYWFVEGYPIHEFEQEALCSMIRAYEKRSNLDQLECEDDQEETNDAFKRSTFELAKDHAIRREGGRWYFAPYDVIFSYGFMVRSGNINHSTVQALAKVSQDVQELKTMINQMHEGGSISFDTKSVNALAAKIFFSGLVMDYSRGEGSKKLEHAGMLPKSIGKGGNTQTVAELANLLFKSYGVDVTHYRVHRLCLLRALTAKMLKQRSDEDSENWDLPEDFWTAVSKKTTALMDESTIDSERKAETFATLLKIMAQDKKKYGDFDVLEDAAMVKAERELDMCIAEAQGLVVTSAVDYLDRTQLSQVPSSSDSRKKSRLSNGNEFAQVSSNSDARSRSRPSAERPPVASRSSTSRPSTSNPSTERLSTERPSTSNPSTERPSTSRPSTSRPSTSRLSTELPQVTSAASSSDNRPRARPLGSSSSAANHQMKTYGKMRPDVFNVVDNPATPTTLRRKRSIADEDEDEDAQEVERSPYTKSRTRTNLDSPLSTHSTVTEQLSD
ncbi:hypothetical protein CF319_g7830 [Tilletia indica]|nr:hypothetical protein CF319_g7830 [Tilletia indica]